MRLSSHSLLIPFFPLIYQATTSPASPAKSINISPNSTDSLNNVNNTIIPGAVVPSRFTIQPSVPGPPLGPDEDSAQTLVLIQTLRGIQSFSLEDFDAETLPWTFDHPWFRIDVDGPTSSRRRRILCKHSIWGLYSAIWYMISHSIYRELTFNLLEEESLVGQIRFIRTYSPTLGTNNDTSADVNSLSTVLPKMNSTWLGTVATDVTSSSPLGAIFYNGRLTAEIDMAGKPLLVTDVFMTLFTAFVKLAPKPKAQLLLALDVRGDYQIWLHVDNLATTPRRRFSHLTNEAVIWALGRVAVAMVNDHNNWRETQMTIKLDNKLVGVGSMVAASSAPLALASSYNLNVTIL